ncbi:MAG: CCA tRNA nucleotidyltransferase [Clostridia bacterium]|nr:CCA tRNA nucleotidyltransferase [Clostridia bacterium]
MNKTNSFKPASKTAVLLLKNSGFEAFLIGGSVRDFIMGLPIGDIDITTNATPAEVKKVFKDFRVIETGIKHGTVTVLIDNEPLEITTYRSESSYSDNRHPDSVTFSKSLSDDVVRRDFTMNAIAYDFNDGFRDLVNGIDDIKNQTIRCIGDAQTRFREDALRILRALRFSSVLGFSIEEKTKYAIHECKDLLLNISAERIREEFVKLICGKNAYSVLQEFSDVIAVFIPEIKPCINFKQENRHHCFDVYTHSLKALENSNSDVAIRLALFFHDIAKPLVAYFDEKGEQHYYGHPKKSAETTEKILTRLRFDNETKNKVVTLVAFHDSPIMVNDSVSPDRKRLKKIMSQIGVELIFPLIEIKFCDNSAQKSEYYRGDDFYKETKSIINDILKEKECFSIKDLAINGNDLMGLGFKGKKIGETLTFLLDLVINEKIKNEYDEILSYLNNKK